MEGSIVETAKPMEKKLKAQEHPEEESGGERESEPEPEPEAKPKYKVPEKTYGVTPPDWGYDSFEGKEYKYKPPKVFSSDDEDDEWAKTYTYEDAQTYKRQLIESKGFKVDPNLKPSYRYRRIRERDFEEEVLKGVTFLQHWEEMARACLQKYNEDKPEDSKAEFVRVVRGNWRVAPKCMSYITFMARENNDGPLVEYQAKACITFDGKSHPVLCRPAPGPSNYR